jgi:hypothetical protein
MTRGFPPPSNSTARSSQERQHCEAATNKINGFLLESRHPYAYRGSRIHFFTAKREKVRFLHSNLAKI